MAKSSDEMVEMIFQEDQEEGRKVAQAKTQFSGVGYFRSQEDFLNELCIELNKFSVFGKNFKICDRHRSEPFLHLRMVCKGVEKEKIKELVKLLQVCNLDAEMYNKPNEINKAPAMMKDIYSFVMVTGVRNDAKLQSPTSKLSEFADPRAIEALQNFADENKPSNKSGCCAIS